MGSGRYDRIVHMIEESEKLKSTAEDKAARLARRQGIAIAIGHPHDSTLRALERWENREGVAVVPLRRYVWHLAQLRAGQAGRPE